jgi:hypothetical protein
MNNIILETKKVSVKWKKKHIVGTLQKVKLQNR